MAFEVDHDFESVVQIKVIGVGGGGGNAVNRMVDAGITGVEFISVNTDRQALLHSKATHKMQIGEKVTKGQGAGGQPTIGRESGEESREDIEAALKSADMVFITAGMGGGTGTGAAPIIADVAKSLGILTVGIVTRPFDFEGKRRARQAEDGIRELAEFVDSLIIIPNERLKLMAETHLSIREAFAAADGVLLLGVRSISDLIKEEGFINLDFADVSSIMKDAGYAHMGVGRASGKSKAELAAKAAVDSPLLETTISGAKGVIIGITASPDMELDDIEAASSAISKEASDDANIIWGVTFDESFEDEIEITVIATGFGDLDSKKASEKDKTFESDFKVDVDISSNKKKIETPSSAGSDWLKGVDDLFE